MKIGTAPIKVLPVLAAAAMCTAGFADGNGSLIYENGYPNGCNGFRSQIGGNTAADDYTGADAQMGGLHWYTLDNVGATWGGNVTIAIHDTDGACLPVNPPVSFTSVPADGGVAARTLVLSPGPFGFDRHRYDATCLDLALVSGQFIGAQTDTTADSFWETSRCGANGDTILGCDGAYQIGGVWDTFFNLFGDVYDLAYQVSSVPAGGDACACDFDSDGDVDVDDLLVVLGNWGGPGGDCTGDGITNVDDLLAVLGEWGPCGTGGPANDECENATLVFEGTYAFDTTGATVNPDDPAWSCASGGGPDIWYCFKADCTGPVEVSTCDDADYDTAITVYTTSNPDCTGDLVEVVCNDDGIGCGGFTSIAAFAAVEGEHYKIRIGGFNGAVGTGNVTITCGNDANNQDCENAIAMAVDSCESGDTTGASVDIVPDCDGIIPVNGGLWYSVIGDGTTLTATTCAPGTVFDTILSVYCGGCNQLFCVGANDEDPVCFNNFVGESTVQWCSAPGEEYLILVHGNAEGAFELCVTSDGIACSNPPVCVFVCNNTSGIVNDCCEDRLDIFDGVTAYDSTGANTDGQADASCQFDGQTYQDLWYNYTATCDGLLTVSTCNDAAYDTDLVVYDGCGPCYDFALLGCNDDGAGCAGFTSLVTVPVAAGNCYKIRVGGWNDGDQGAGNLTIACNPFCDWVCPDGASAECGPQQCPVDGDDANNDGNGGCNNAVPAYCSIAIGETVCGQGSTYVDISGGAFRDTDWYEFSVPAGGQEITLTCNAEGSTLYGIVDHQGGACTGAVFVVSATTAGNCDEQSVSAFLAEGTYVAFASPSVFEGIACGGGQDDYWLRLDGGGGPCTFECPAGSSDEQGPQACPVDGDDANNDGNGGCNNVPTPLYGAIAEGETVCGKASTYIDISGGAFRDTDWYQFTANAAGTATLTCNGESAMLFGIVDHQNGACTGAVFVGSGTTGGNCDEQSVSVTGLVPGQSYVAFASPTVFAGITCDIGDYWIRLDP